MIIRFDKEYLRELYGTGKCKDKRYRYQPVIIRKYKVCIDILLSVSTVEQLFPFKSLNYENLKMDKKGISSIRVNDQYRIEFTVKKESVEPIITVCDILDLTNHYK